MWTPDRPTKPGRYELSLHPDRRGNHTPHTLERSVVLIPRWLIDGGEEVEPRALAVRLEADAESPWIRVSDAVFDRALWRPYVEPADPHAQPVPQQLARLTLSIPTEERQTLSGSLHAMAGSLRKCAETNPSEAHRAIAEANKMDALNARICEGM